MDERSLLRIEALDRAVRVSLALGGESDSETIVKRAEAFSAFLESK